MLRAIEVDDFGALRTEQALDGRVPGQLFADGVAGQVPRELVPPFDTAGQGGCGFELLVAVVQAGVVFADSLGEGGGRHGSEGWFDRQRRFHDAEMGT